MLLPNVLIGLWTPSQSVHLVPEVTVITLSSVGSALSPFQVMKSMCRKYLIQELKRLSPSLKQTCVFSVPKLVSISMS